MTKQKKFRYFILKKKKFDFIFFQKKKFPISHFEKTKSDIIKQHKGNPVFELDDLILLYHNANPILRGYMLLGLNLGHTQKEISTMLNVMVDLDKRIVSRYREKTDFTAKKMLQL